MSVSITTLLTRIPGAVFHAAGGMTEDHVITRFSADSRAIEAGHTFVATPGTHSDPSVWISDALTRGAALIVAPTQPPEHANTAWLEVPDAFLALAIISAAFHGDPARDVRVLATTGTNGKTTTSFLLQAMLSAAGHRTGLLSTVRVDTTAATQPTIFTTPPAPEFHRLLAAMRDAGCAFAAVEASSHGLDQRRIAALDVAVAGYTNLSRDHLDYHGTMEAYATAKARLFTDLARAAAICVDDPTGHAFAALFAARSLPLLTLSTTIPAASNADIRVIDAHFDLQGSRGHVALPDGSTRPFRTQLVGAHNLQNAIVALAMAHLAGLTWDDALGHLATAAGAPGRLEPVVVHQSHPTVFVDYAHTPDALARVLATLRDAMRTGHAYRNGRILCVFGAGGDRDRGKRPEMAQAVAAHADLVIATSDNPRTESPEAILDDVVAGLPHGHPHVRIADRGAAIAYAIDHARADDVVLIAGKGHEDYQIIGSEKIFFDDRVVARAALAARAKEAAR